MFMELLLESQLGYYLFSAAFAAFASVYALQDILLNTKGRWTDITYQMKLIYIE